jgi:hypothetical protein
MRRYTTLKPAVGSTIGSNLMKLLLQLACACHSLFLQASKLVKLVQSTSLSEATWLQLASSWQSHSAAITAATAAAATAGGCVHGSSAEPLAVT